MNEKIYQKIVDALQEVLPDKWERIVFYVNYIGDSYSIKYYVDLGNGEYIDCFELDSISNIQLVRLFVRIDKIISKERDHLDKKSKWNVMTMIVNSNGDFKADYDYSDITENFVAYEEKWKKHYLK